MEKPRIGIISNYPNKMREKPATFFEQSFNGFEDKLVWEFISYKDLLDQEKFQKALKMDGLVLSSSEFYITDPYVQNLMAVELQLIRDFHNPIYGMCFGQHLQKLAFGADISNDTPEFSQGDETYVDFFSDVPVDPDSEKILSNQSSDSIDFSQNTNAHINNDKENNPVEFIQLFDDACNFQTPPLPCEVGIMQHKTRPIFGIDFSMGSNDRELAQQAAVITLRKFLTHFFN
ncbi:MAG: hypothetical protein ACTSRK_12805 [Promethearchaeota archaeon]